MGSLGSSELVWRKSSYSAAANGCVEVGAKSRLFAVRDSKDPAGGALTFGDAAWRAFLGAVR
ncbi:DUF397 domain-containing protein [Amycolatopsis nigrescens]|uniref:DUF397 domain-containing protein n=1 Tax=Amycolatopsis nigrescens TaxID=381445 RepID=UPI0003642F09|nr:DUF397 domain-containing protein [Amycolatopsis nigrescens]